MEKETAITPRRPTATFQSQTSVKKDSKKVQPTDRSPLNININYATNESTQSIGVSTAPVPTTQEVLDSGEVSVTAFPINERKHTS